MAKKMSKGLIALSSAAIVSVYGAGYALTQPAAVSMAAGQTTSPVPAAPSASSASSVPTSRTGSSAVNSPAAIATSASSTNTGLKDGTYSGTGSSRHGGVTVKVTIQNGRIIAAPISSVTTRYSQNVISALPGEVLTRQSSAVDMISGATDSSMAYRQAVAQALSQAGGAPATTGTTSGAAGGSVQVTGPNGTTYSNPGGRRERGFYGND